MRMKATKEALSLVGVRAECRACVKGQVQVMEGDQVVEKTCKVCNGTTIGKQAPNAEAAKDALNAAIVHRGDPGYRG